MDAVGTQDATLEMDPFDDFADVQHSEPHDDDHSDHQQSEQHSSSAASSTLPSVAHLKRSAQEAYQNAKHTEEHSGEHDESGTSKRPRHDHQPSGPRQVAFWQLRRSGSSFSGYNNRARQLNLHAAEPNPLATISRKSKRMAALFRFFQLLAATLKPSMQQEAAVAAEGHTLYQGSVRDVLRIVRLKQRYTTALLQPDEAKDREALIANSTEDKIMIQCIEDCSTRIGYAVLRALAVVREYGSELAQGLGLYALISHKTTLTSFVALTEVQWNRCVAYSRRQWVSESILLRRSVVEAALLNKFQTLNQTFPSDLTEKDQTDYAFLDLDSSVLLDEFEQEAAFWRDVGAFTDVLRYGRMQEQAGLQRPAPTPSHINPNDTPAVKAQKTTKHTNLHIARRHLLQALYGADMLVEQALGEGTPLAVSALKVLQDVIDALELTCSTQEMWQRMQQDLVLRVRFIEAVMVQRFSGQALATSTDARPALVRQMDQLMQYNLDYFVEKLALD